MPANVECSRAILLSLVNGKTPVFPPALSSYFLPAAPFPDNSSKKSLHPPRGIQVRLVINERIRVETSGNGFIWCNLSNNIQVWEDGHWCSVMGNQGPEQKKSERADRVLELVFLLTRGAVRRSDWDVDLRMIKLSVVIYEWRYYGILKAPFSDLSAFLPAEFNHFHHWPQGLDLLHDWACSSHLCTYATNAW